MEYEFELKFKLATDESDTDELVERLGAAGCDDALMGIGQLGHIALKFTREAISAKRAIASALKDVEKAIPRSTLVETGKAAPRHPFDRAEMARDFRLVGSARVTGDVNDLIADIRAESFYRTYNPR